LNELLTQAARFHAVRDFRAAEAACRTIVRLDPHHFGALHLRVVSLTSHDSLEKR